VGILEYFQLVSATIDSINVRADSLILKLSNINQQVNRAMKTAQEFNDLLISIDKDTDRLAVTIEELKAKLVDGGLTPAEEADIFDGLQSVADKLKAVGKDPTPTP
jgi:uncharacterized coiled-coil DUF342 family protein